MEGKVAGTNVEEECEQLHSDQHRGGRTQGLDALQSQNTAHLVARVS